jgi:hypothetical protein
VSWAREAIYFSERFEGAGGPQHAMSTTLGCEAGQRRAGAPDLVCEKFVQIYFILRINKQKGLLTMESNWGSSERAKPGFAENATRIDSKSSHGFRSFNMKRRL